MSTARRLTPQSVCLFCRLSARLAGTYRRGVPFPAGSTTTYTAPTIRQHSRNFSISRVHRDQRDTPASANASTSSQSAGPQPTGEAADSTPHLSNISSASLPTVEAARQKWQDSLPDALLNTADRRLWDTLYGPPKRIWSSEETARIETMLRDGLLLEEAVLIVDGVGAGGGITVREEAGYSLDDDGVLIYHGPVDDEGRPIPQDDTAAAADQPADNLDEYPVSQHTLPFRTQPPSAPPAEEPYRRNHPMTIRGRFATYPTTVYYPHKLQLTTASLLKDTKFAHFRERAIAYNPPSLMSPGMRSSGAGYHPNILPDMRKGDKLDASVWLGTVLPEIYAVNIGVATEIRRRLGGEWARGVRKVLDVGGGGAGILAWGDIVKAERMAMEEVRMGEASGTPETRGSGEGRAKGRERKEVPMQDDRETWDWGHGVEGVQAMSMDEEFKFEATVVTASMHVRAMASKILQNTTFLPRTPYRQPAPGSVRWDVPFGEQLVDIENPAAGTKASPAASATETPSSQATEGEESQVDTEGLSGDTADDKKQPPVNPQRSYDLIFASYTLEHIKVKNAFNHHIDNLWQLLNPGGVLCLVELGNRQGFNNVATARQRLLRKWIKSPLSQKKPALDDEAAEPDVTDVIEEDILGDSAADTPPPLKPAEAQLEDGMIVAPCTNHNECPMHLSSRTIFKSQDLCRFYQRYQRPPFLQRALPSKTSDHADSLFSYVAVRRGAVKDESVAMPQEVPRLRPDADPDAKLRMRPVPLDLIEESYTEEQKRQFMFMQPRLILPPIKGDHHITMDVCTSDGELERWIVASSFGKEAYRDARKAKWGDLWLYGAKTKVLRVPKDKVREQQKLTREEKGLRRREEKKGKDKVQRVDGKKGQRRVTVWQKRKDKRGGSRKKRRFVADDDGEGY
ncbi:37S ribosomal protein S22 [Orbilia brochopaga]|uniref:37S ribosomal protein S22 n=1 Tax=Orbilia brochopaga TaxID=3140254 RepID=A0AAV9V0V2_9PEZI